MKHQWRASLKAGLASFVVVMALALGGCATTGQTDNTTTGSIPSLGKPVDQMTPAEVSAATQTMGQAYAKSPKNPRIGIAYASLLQMDGRAPQALAVMQQVAIANPKDRSVLAAYGKAQAAAGELQDALSTIRRAQTPDRPDWRLYSAEGAVLDQLGRSDEAHTAYNLALQIKPNEPTVLSNLGMSYVLTGDLKTAESYLRTAIKQPGADSRVRQNLALVVGLQGRFAEAETIAAQELSPQQAAANVAYLRGMLSQQNSWKQLAANKGTPQQQSASGQ
ncbi:tetratricopeptide repeat protein [Allorhizobium sp. BGMRC 0089]|uniref:tetratricopeptide repeat protein n=1 Tax=Allorhizobium sonneratiae TaxID=2934936 RepID=UPI0020343890|nr:tetratricopeptide repeat protein [Allorhizobium sonneratiae]MCM2291642.1 tetratricopeptide repeat protein [Allorhizobium sonneratiae]